MSDTPQAIPLPLRLIYGLSNLCGIVAAGMVMASIIITCQMIYVRFVLNHSTIWQTETVIYLMIGATMLGLPYVQKLKGHVNVDLLPLLLPSKLRMALALFVSLAVFGLAGVFAYYGYDMWHLAWDRGWRSDTVWGVKLWIPYLVVPIGFGLYALQVFAETIALLMGYERPFNIDPDKELG